MFALLMGLKTISPAALQQLLQGSQPVHVFDVNSRQSWLRARVSGAINLDPLAFKDGDLPENKNDAVVFYCSNPMCRKAPSAARRAGRIGYANARVMSAGISGWVAAGLPTQSGE